MENLLKDKATDLAKKLAKEVTKMAQQDMPDLSLAKKITKAKMKEKYESAVNECKNAMDDQLNNAMAEGTQIVEDFKSDLNGLGTELGTLAVGTAQFAARIAMIPPALIVTTPMGPGISTNLVTPMLQDLKAEGDLLSKTYDDSYHRRNKLRIDMLASVVPGLDAIMAIHDSTTAIAKPLITLVGAACDGEAGSIPEVEPPLTITYNASECSSYSPKDEGDEENPSVSNCSRFSAIFESDGVSCNNCKNYR